MDKPIVAIVGRPNVGKSTFFNRVSGKKTSIVENRPGVTRDRVYADCDWNGCAFALVDTGGLELKSDDVMFRHIRTQAEIAVDTADLILFFCDAKTGLSSDDYEVCNYLRKQKKPVFLVVNKADNNRYEEYADFYSLGMDNIYPISSEAGYGVADLLDEIVKALPHRVAPEGESDRIRIAVVGRPNAGKSSLVNRILGYDRTIVSDMAGTTRDAVDTDFTYQGRKYTIVDTAGIRRQRSISEEVESYSVMRALGAIRRADVCLLVLDSTQEISEQDVRIAGYINEQGKPSVVVMNKWDLVDKDTNTINKYEQKLRLELKFMDYVKSAYVSALTGKRAEKLISLVDEVTEASKFRATTGTLNDVIHDCVASNPPPLKGGKRLKILYATQVDIQPPTFVVFTNDSSLMHFSYKRFLENKLREAFPLEGTPLRLFVRDKTDEGGFTR